MTHAKRVARSLWQPESGIQSILFFGQEGAELQQLANAVAMGWLCKAPLAEGACGECASCRAMRDGQHVDLLRVSPRGQGNFIRVQDISGGGDQETIPLQSFVRTRPLMARHKVVLMEQVDRLHDRAANALLKTLEEPEPHVRLVLITHYPSKVLRTIMSRCSCIACSTEVDPDSALGPDLRARVRAVFDEAAALAPHGGLRLSEKVRALAESYAKSKDVPIRQAQGVLLQEFGQWLLHELPHAPHAVERAVLVHRLIQGNANGATQLDALFTWFLQDCAQELHQKELSA